MKFNAMASALFLFTTSAFATPVLQAVHNPGFVSKPASITITLDSDGTMIHTTKEFRTGKETTKLLAKFSKDGMDSIVKQIGSVNLKTTLIDLNKDEPRCTDAPSFHVSIFVNGQEKQIYAWSSCHTFELEFHEGVELAKMIQIFI